MTLSNLGKDIFIGNSAATSHMTRNKTGVYNLTPIKGSVMIGNGESITCTHKGKLDVICRHKDGSMAREGNMGCENSPSIKPLSFRFHKSHEGRMADEWEMEGRRFND